MKSQNLISREFAHRFDMNNAASFIAVEYDFAVNAYYYYYAYYFYAKLRAESKNRSLAA